MNITSCITVFVGVWLAFFLPAIPLIFLSVGLIGYTVWANFNATEKFELILKTISFITMSSIIRGIFLKGLL